MLLTPQEIILQEAWTRYSDNLYTTTLGKCIMAVYAPMRLPQHSILSKLDGSVAVQYFEQHYASK